MKKKTPVILLALLLLGGSVWLGTVCTYRHEAVFLRQAEPALFYIEPDLPETRAAANSFAYTLKQALGTESAIITEKSDSLPTLQIIIGEEEADETERPEYSVKKEGGDIVIRVAERSSCLGAVMAVAEHWLQADCGLSTPGELRISQRMIDEQLSNLSTAIKGELRILTQNLYYTSAGEGHSVHERAERFFRLVEDYQPDLIGTQECTLRWKKLLQSGLGEHYEYLGIPREGLLADDEEWDDAILFRKDRFELQDYGYFWLSNTPDEPLSQLNYDDFCRSCTWAVLTDTKTGKTLLFTNTHLHHQDDEYYQQLRDRQAEILLRYLRRGENKLAKYPGFLTGDFNGTSDEAFYDTITDWYDDSGKTAITNSSNVNYSYHGFGTVVMQQPLDYCFHSPGNVTVLDYRILDDWYGGYISDHYGILVTAVLN